MIRYSASALTVLAVLFAAGESTGAATIFVPASFPTIQEAINAASTGDVIVVSPGIYGTSLEITGKSLTLRSSTGRPEDVILGVPGIGTIVKAQDAGELRFESVSLRDGGGSRALICGSAALVTLIGGAVQSVNSDVVFDNCVLADNTADIGGVIFLVGGSLTIRDSVITGNGRALTTNGSASVGSVVRTCDRTFCTILIEDSIVTDNGDLNGALNLLSPFNATTTLRRTKFERNLGSVFSPFGITTAVIESCEFRNNTGNGAVVSTAGVSSDAELTIDSSIFDSNTGSTVADVAAFMPSGFSKLTITNSKFLSSSPQAISYVQQPDGAAVIDRCEIRGAGSAGISLFVDGGTTEITNSLIAGSGGDGIILSGVNTPAITTIANSTIVGSGNIGVRPEALLNGTLRVSNSIITRNVTRQISTPQIPIGQTISVRRSIIQGGFAGAGNLNVDPQFVAGTGPNGNYNLLETSPAIDAGNNSLVLPPVTGDSRDLAGNPRFADVLTVSDTGTGSSPIVDIGAYEFTPAGCACVADFDGSGGTPDSTDIDVFFTAWLAGEATADADCSGGTPDSTDIDSFFSQWLAGGC